MDMRIELTTCDLRFYRASDAPRLAQVANNPNVAKYLANMFPVPYTLTDAEFWVSEQRMKELPNEFAICAKSSDEHGEKDEVIGGIGVRQQADTHTRSYELGYWLAEPYWGRGIMTEATAAIARWAFNHFGDECQRVWAGLFSENKASRRVLEKAGFVYEGTLRNDVWKHGGLMDTVLLSVVRGDSLLQDA